MTLLEWNGGSPAAHGLNVCGGSPGAERKQCDVNAFHLLNQSWRKKTVRLFALADGAVFPEKVYWITSGTKSESSRVMTSGQFTGRDIGTSLKDDVPVCPITCRDMSPECPSNVPCPSLTI